MGGETVTVRGLKVVGVDAEKDILTIQGLVPGVTQGLLLVQKDNR
jgi:ribosomal protein L3